MKLKTLTITAICLLIGTQAFAGKSINIQSLRVSKAVIEDLSLTSGVVVTTDTVRMKGNVGFTSLLIKEDKAGGAGDVDIFAEYSLDKDNWYRAYTSNMSGAITQEGNIATTIQNSTRWIVFTPRMAPYMRLKFDPDADSQITATLIYQEEY